MLILPLFLGATSLTLQGIKEEEALAAFLRLECEEEAYGYVLEGSKPVSIRDFYSLVDFPLLKDLEQGTQEFAHSILARKAILAWNRLCSHQDNFILKVVTKDSHAPAPTLEVSFINKKKLQEVIQENLFLFRYVLGPHLTTDKLMEEIIQRPAPLSSILQNNMVLEGVILGFGSYNSLVYGRLETLNAFIEDSRDLPPFLSKNLLAHRNKTLVECFSPYYLDFSGNSSDQTLFHNAYSPLFPSFGFSSLEEELETLQKKAEPTPSCLEHKPLFVFGAFKEGPPNQKLFQKLVQGQKYSKSLLRRSDFLATALEKINGFKPVVSHDVSLEYPTITDWVLILKKVAYSFKDLKSKTAFVQALFNPESTDFRVPKMIGAVPETLLGLNTARAHLVAANQYFEMLSQKTSLKTVAPQKLYFEITQAGEDLAISGHDHVRLGYAVENQKGEVLFANHDLWIHLSHTIPSFIHGLQGMQIGEKRTVFIHPTLGYGFMTTLPLCSELIIKVHLIDIEANSTSALPSLEPLDLSLIQNPQFYELIKSSVEQVPRFKGAFYHHVLMQVEGAEKKEKILREFAKFSY